MQQKNFQLEAADMMNYGGFAQTPIGALLLPMLKGDAALYARCDTEVKLIESGIVSTLNLIADGVERGDLVDVARAGSIAEALRLMASLTGFCISARDLSEFATERAIKVA